MSTVSYTDQNAFIQPVHTKAHLPPLLPLGCQRLAAKHGCATLQHERCCQRIGHSTYTDIVRPGIDV